MEIAKINKTPEEQPPMMSLVKRTISMMTCKGSTNSGKKSEKAIALSRNYSPVEVMVAYGTELQSTLPSLCPSIHLATEAEGVPTLRLLAEAYDEETRVLWIKANLIKLNEFVGTKEKLSDRQQQDLALQIFHEHGYLNLFEVLVFFGRLRSGRYEEFYGSIDPMRVLKSLNSFCSDRRNDLDRVHNEREKEEERKNNAGRVTVNFEDWYSSLSEEKRKEIREMPYFNTPIFKAISKRVDGQDDKQSQTQKR